MRSKVAILASPDPQIDAPVRRLSIDWDDFRVFVAVADQGSFRKAAKSLAMMQSTVTRRIAKLERSVGTALFKRSRKGPELTVRGREVLSHAKSAEVSLMQAIDLVPAKTVEGDCKLLVSDGIGAYWLARFVPGFQEAYPNIDFKMFTATDPTISQRPPYDLQVQFSSAEEKDSVPVRLGTLHFMLFASPEYLQIFGTPKALEDLADHRLLDLTLSLSSKGRFSSLSKADRSPHTRFFSNSSVVLAEAVRAGAGIAMLPTYAPLVDSRFVPIFEQPFGSTGIFVNYDRDVGASPAVRAVLNYLKETIFDRKNMPWFRDTFEPPDPSWNELFRAQLGRSRLRRIET
jgi:DNA-binding transcriptional LysR family regulator